MHLADFDKTAVANEPLANNPVRRKLPERLLGRFYLVIVGLLSEYTVVVSAPHPWCHVHRAVAAAIVFLAVFLFVARPSLKSERTPLKLDLRLLAFYGLSLVVIAAIHATLLYTLWGAQLLVVLWFAAIPVSAVLLLLALIPLRVLPILLRLTKTALTYATVATLLTILFSDRIQAIWDAPQTWGSAFLQRTTFHEVGRLLQLFYPHVSSDPATYTVFLPKFDTTIAGGCSGIEGLCLTLLFSTGWLWYARKELRFPQALLLIPCALSLIWILNIFRIAMLLAIGNSGHPDVADIGFHSEAGWIAFNSVSLTLLAAADRIRWLRKSGSVDKIAERNVAAIYLLPFLAILVADSLSKAASSGFEWFYPLRFLLAAIVLWHYRKEYQRMDWSFGWEGPVAGVLVFLMWLGLSRWTLGSANNTLGATLAGMPTLGRISWIAFRTAAAVVTVPIAEELAFRGFLLRRLTSADPESIAYRNVTPLAIMLSSTAFGVMHGNLWLAGILAGIIYALVIKRTGRLGEAFAAHATTNLLLAVWVLTRSDWGLW
jgi:exosortase E/protease (VPEID-CTERM system)